MVPEFPGKRLKPGTDPVRFTDRIVLDLVGS
jgi:hypothetical protein